MLIADAILWIAAGRLGMVLLSGGLIWQGVYLGVNALQARQLVVVY